MHGRIAAEISVLDRIEHPEKSELLTPIRMQYQKIFNTNIVANSLCFLTHPYMHQSDSQSNGHGYPMAAVRHKIQRKAGN
jgi:hypothetical protein